MLTTPRWPPSVGNNDELRSVSHHRQGVFGRLIGPPIHGYALAPHTNGIAVLAKEYAMAQTRFNARNIGRDMENASSEKQNMARIRSGVAAQSELVIPNSGSSDVVMFETYSILMRLGPSPLQQPFATNPSRE